MSRTATASEQNWRLAFWRYTILLHRYVGITISLVILLWCVSGIIMMYVQYPAFEKYERLAGLQQLDLSDSESWHVNTSPSDTLVTGFALESMRGDPVLRLQSAGNNFRVLNLTSGNLLTKFESNELATIADSYAANRGWSAATSSTWIERDQWTVHSRFARHRPLLKVRNDDAIEWYVSGQTGEVVQTTNRNERAWNWLGSVVHWLYPTVLRQHVMLWSQTVIWLTICGLFLTITGVTIGIKQFGKRRNGRRTPYGGWALWHHYAGLVFGVLTLTWLFSGLFSMNPWGALESRSVSAERELLNGVNLPVAETVKHIKSARGHIPAGSARIESAFWLGEPFLAAYDREGRVTRIGNGVLAAELDRSDIEIAAARLGAEVADIELLNSGDSYYYSHHTQRAFPVYRLTDMNGERYYISAKTGALLKFVDTNARRYRWLFNAFHAGDFHQIARMRPIWDVFMLILLLGVSVGVASGTWLGLKRLMR